MLIMSRIIQLILMVMDLLTILKQLLEQTREIKILMEIV